MKRTLFPNNNTGNGLPLGSVTLLSISRFSCGTVTQRATSQTSGLVIVNGTDVRASTCVCVLDLRRKRDKGRGGRATTAPQGSGTSEQQGREDMSPSQRCGHTRWYGRDFDTSTTPCNRHTHPHSDSRGDAMAAHTRVTAATSRRAP